METPTRISLSQITQYNPRHQRAEVVEALFVARQQQFQSLLAAIKREGANSIPQHHLVIGQRGMGKSTLLKRLEVELHKPEYREQFIPVLFPEEQYNVKDLAVFWINCLDTLADSLDLEDKEGNRVQTSAIDKMRKKLSSRTSETVASEAYEYFMSRCHELRRRPVLLIDNIGLVFKRLDGNKKTKPEQWALRKVLSENGAPIIVGAGPTVGHATVAEEVLDYKMPFYDFFQIQHFRKLRFEEFMALLEELARRTQLDEKITLAIREKEARLKTLYLFSGGNPRTAVMLFKLFVKGFESEIADDLDALVDSATPLYKANFEDLPQQQQIIVGAIAMHWHAIPFRELIQNTGLEANQLSPQLKRLMEDGWIEKVEADKKSRKAKEGEDRAIKGGAYSICERFFNVWFLIRCGNRRDRQGVRHLSKFLECLYGPDRLQKVVDDLLQQNLETPRQIMHGLTLAESKLLDPERKKRLKGKAYDGILKLSKYDKGVLKEYDIPEDEITERLKQYDIAQLRELIDNANYDSTSLTRMGSALSDDGQHEKSIVCYDKTIVLESKNAKAWRNKGYALHKLGRFEEAITCFDEAIELEPNDANYWWWKGNCLSDLKQHEEAIVCFDKAIGLEPNDAYHWCGKGACLSNLKQHEEAIVCLDKAIGLEPEDAVTWHSKGYALKNLGRFEEAVACLDEAIRLEPEKASTWNGKGYALNELGRFEEAIACCDKAIELEPENATAWNNKGYALKELGRFEEAVACYDKATELESENATVWSNKGYALIGLKNYQEAAVTYERARTLAPEEVWTKLNLIFLYRDKLGRKDDALELFKEIEQVIHEDENKKIMGCYHLHKALFELHDQNKGLAKEHLSRAFAVLEEEDRLATVAKNYWWTRFGGVVIDLGYGAWLLEILEEKGYDVALSPYYTALQALELEKQDPKNGAKDAEIYLKNRAVEISEPARMIIETIRKSMG
ncbi:MAG: tetratricopeptide repeat protein [Kiritimatiellaeota bacterium]|nr:tetratricopeptide repeat protein [Kiritimatiellota bacterium]